MSYKKAEKFYNNNNHELSYVVNELELQEYKGIYFRKENSDIASCLVEDDIIGDQYIELDISNLFDKKFEQYLNALYRNGVKVISKHGSTYTISLWSSLDLEKGLIYSPLDINEDIPGIISEKSIVDNWSYYENSMDLWLEQQ